VVKIVEIGAAAVATRPHVEVQTKTPQKIQWEAAFATPVPPIEVLVDTKAQNAPKLVMAPKKR